MRLKFQFFPLLLEIGNELAFGGFFQFRELLFGFTYKLSQAVHFSPGNLLAIVSGDKLDPVWFGVATTTLGADNWFGIDWYTKIKRKGGFREAEFQLSNAASERACAASILTKIDQSSWKYGVGTNVIISTTLLRNLKTQASQAQVLLEDLDAPALIDPQLLLDTSAPPHLTELERQTNFLSNYPQLIKGIEKVCRCRYSFNVKLVQIQEGRIQLAFANKLLQDFEANLILNHIGTSAAPIVLVFALILPLQASNTAYVRYVESATMSGIARAYSKKLFPERDIVLDDLGVVDVPQKTRRQRPSTDHERIRKLMLPLLETVRTKTGLICEFVMGDDLNAPSLEIRQQEPTHDSIACFIRGITLQKQSPTKSNGTKAMLHVLGMMIVLKVMQLEKK